MNRRDLAELISLKLKLEEMKPLYSRYDELLQMALNHDKVPPVTDYEGRKWSIKLVDNFDLKNTSWKSVAIRRFDLAIQPMAGPITPEPKRVKPAKRNVPRGTKSKSVFKIRRSR
jgi:hypothetical protein